MYAAWRAWPVRLAVRRGTPPSGSPSHVGGGGAGRRCAGRCSEKTPERRTASPTRCSRGSTCEQAHREGARALAPAEILPVLMTDSFEVIEEVVIAGGR